MTERQIDGERKTLVIKYTLNQLVNVTRYRVKLSWTSGSLTSSFFILHQNLQLEQSPGNLRVISHHGQRCLKLSFHAKLYTPISYTQYTNGVINRSSQQKWKQTAEEVMAVGNTNCLPTVRFASCGGKSVVTRRCRKIWLSWLRVVCFSAFVMGSGGIILS